MCKNGFVDNRKNVDSTRVFIDENGVTQIRVSGGSSIVETAGCALKCLENGETVQLRAMGASAVNQMFKSMATLRIMLKGQKNAEVYFRPEYDTAQVWDAPSNKVVDKTIMVGYVIVEESESNGGNNKKL